MHLKLLTSLAIAIAVPTAAACGSSSSGSHSRASSASHRRRHGTVRTYRLKLSGAAETPPGPSGARGGAVIAFHGSSKVCWRFAHLRGFSGATFAHIHKGAAGTSGNIVIPLSTGPKLKHRGCVSANPTMVKAIEEDPPGYYVNIHSIKNPGGAVRSQL